MFCKPPHPVYIVLFRGDDTDFVGNQEIVVKITTERNISGCKAYFKYMGNIQTFDEIPEDKELHLVFSREQTKEMPLGTWDAELYLIDENGKRMTVNNRIHMLVTNSVREAYFPDDPQAVSVVISANKYIEDAEVSADGKTLTLTKKDGTEVSFSGGGGGGGTNDYNDLENKPSINGTTLTGNVTLTTPEQLELKADKATTLAGYGITDAVPLVEDVNGEKTAVTIGSRSGIVGPYSLANGNNVTASGQGSHAEGLETVASGVYSRADGMFTEALGPGSYALGYMTKTLPSHRHAFVWNGYGLATEKYPSNGEGTFNINPIGGVNGFYVGEKKLSEVISDGIADKADKATTLAGYGITDAATMASLAPEYSPSSAYAVGSFVFNDGNIYQCTTAIADGGEAWNAAHWELRKLDDLFTESNSLLTGTIESKVNSMFANGDTTSYPRPTEG